MEGFGFSDFIAAMVDKKLQIERSHLLEIFNRFSDKRGGKYDGTITPKSIAGCLTGMNREGGGKGNALDDDDSGFITAGAPRPAQLSLWLLPPCLQRLLVCSFSCFAFARVPQASSGPS